MVSDLSTSRRVAVGVLVAFALVEAVPAIAARVATPEVTCAGCFLQDDSGRILYARAAGRPRANASTTKMVTALVVRTQTSLTELVTISANAAATGGGGEDLTAGERHPVEDLLAALLLTSSNDAAVALAEHVTGTEESFVVTMNDLAAELGAEDTNFTTSHGLDAPGHHSSARDLALIAWEVLDDPVLADLVGQPSVRIGSGEVLENRNVLIEGYRGATGVKTGFTANAGDVLVASAERDDRSLVAVAMNSENAAADARALLNYGWAKLQRTPLVGAGSPVGMLVFDPAGATEVTPATVIRGPEDPDAVVAIFEPAADVAPPIAVGEEVGTITVLGPGGETLGRTTAVATDSVPAVGSSWAESIVGFLLRAAGALWEP